MQAFTPLFLCLKSKSYYFLKYQLFTPMSININQNWNEMSSSSSSEEDNRKEEEEEERQEKARSQKEQVVSSQPDNKNVKTKTEGGEEEKPVVREYHQRKRTYLTDQQLLERYKSQTVDNPRAIKVSKCQIEEEREIIKNLKTARVKELNQSTFLIFFFKEEDLIEFFKQKIDKRYKFYFNMFENRERREDDPKRKERKDSYSYRRPERRNTQNSRTSQEDKKDKETQKEGDEKKPERRKKRYYSYQSDNQEDNKAKETKKDEPNIPKPPEQPPLKPAEKPSKVEQKTQKPEPEEEIRPKRKTQHKFMFEIAENSNVILIHSDTFDTHKVLEAISRKKLMKQFSKIHIKAPFYTFAQVSTLLLEIAKFNFFLEKEPPTQAEDEEQEFELVLIEKGQNKTDSFYDRYHKMTLQKEVHVRMLGTKFDDYFMDIDKHNLSEITDGFDADEYIKRLKQSGPIIHKHWNTWRVEAQEDYIQTLLKLINRIRKSTVYDIGLKPSLRNEKALLTAELKERPQNERRPKVDASHANNYLN